MPQAAFPGGGGKGMGRGWVGAEGWGRLAEGCCAQGDSGFIATAHYLVSRESGKQLVHSIALE